MRMVNQSVMRENREESMTMALAKKRAAARKATGKKRGNDDGSGECRQSGKHHNGICFHLAVYGYGYVTGSYLPNSGPVLCRKRLLSAQSIVKNVQIGERKDRMGGNECCLCFSTAHGNAVLNHSCLPG